MTKKKEIDGFGKVSSLSNLISREYASEFFRLLMNYKSISASEAASRLNLHIKTAQDFLEGLADSDIVVKESYRDDKRPYFRYRVLNDRIEMKLDLSEFVHPETGDFPEMKIRESRGSDALFSEGKDNSFRSITLFEGKGRTRKGRRIGLTRVQGRFLFYLPFPTQPPLKIREILKKSGLEGEESSIPEIKDIVQFLIDHEVIVTGNQ